MLLLLFFASAIRGYEWSEIFEDFIENPWISSTYDPSIATFLHVLSGSAYERSTSRRNQCLDPLEIRSTSTKILGDLVESNIGHHRHGRGLIVLFFPGTHDERQLVHEWLKSKDVAFYDVPNARVLDYFREAVDKMWKYVSEHVKKLIKDCPKCAIYFTGHSLGGALALLTLARFLNEGILTENSNLNVYTFGSPRVGNRNFARWLENFHIPIFRVVHSKDIVVHLPCCQTGLFLDCVEKSGSFSPWHAQMEIYYNDDFTTWRTCDGSPHGEDRKCSDKYLVSKQSVDQHKHYFNVHTADMCDYMLEPQLRKLRPNSTHNYNLTMFTWPKVC